MCGALPLEREVRARGPWGRAHPANAGTSASGRVFRIHYPYDGGADVFLAASEERDRMRDRHADWLSRHPAGL
ncbi:DUF3885 domain-containing protein [Streptomyces canus]